MSNLDIADIIGDKLTYDSVVGGTTGFDLKLYFTSDEGDQVISVDPTGGFPQDTLGNENTWGTVQIRVRVAKLDGSLARQKWQEVFNSLQDADLSDRGVFLIQAMNSEPMIYYDAKKRPNMTLNMKFGRYRPVTECSSS